MVATARPELAQARASWGQRPGTWQVALAPLDAQATRDLVADMLPGADALAERVVEVAEGNPFYAEEIVRHLDEHDGGAEPEIPATVRALLAARIDALPEAEQDVLQHAAVVGRRFWPSALEPRWRQAPLAPILRSLERRGFIVTRATSSLPGERELAFVHGLTREVAYRSIPRGARCRVHAAVAAWVEGAGRRPPRRVRRRARPPLRGRGRRPPMRALAWPEGAPEHDELRAAAVRALVEAGEAARRRLSLAQALRFADRALALADAPAERLAAFELRASSHHAAVHGNQALDAYLEAIELARTLGDPEATARLRGYATLLCSRYPGSFIGTEWKAHADDLVDRGLAEAGEDGVDFATAALLIGRAWGTWRWRDPIAEDLPRAKRDAERAAEIAAAIGSSLLLSIALEALTWIAFSQGDCEAVALGERHLHAATTLADRFEAHESLNMAVICFVRAGRFDRARELAAEAARQAPGMSAHRALHAVASQAIALIPGGNFAALLDATDGVEELIAEEREHICANALVALAARAVVLHESGRRSAADAALELFDRVAPPDRPLVRWGPWIVEVTARGRRTAGDASRGSATSRSGTAPGTRSTSCAPSSRCERWRASGSAPTSSRARRARWPARRARRRWASSPTGPTRCAWPPTGTTRGPSRSAARPPPPLAERGERYTAARLMTDLLARLGDAAPPDLVAQTAQRLAGHGGARQRRRRARPRVRARRRRLKSCRAWSTGAPRCRASPERCPTSAWAASPPTSSSPAGGSSTSTRARCSTASTSPSRPGASRCSATPPTRAGRRRGCSTPTAPISCPGSSTPTCTSSRRWSRSARFAEAVLPHGTTTVLIDNHEIANVLGLDGHPLDARGGQRAAAQGAARRPVLRAGAARLRGRRRGHHPRRHPRGAGLGGRRRPGRDDEHARRHRVRRRRRTR